MVNSDDVAGCGCLVIGAACLFGLVALCTSCDNKEHKTRLEDIAVKEVSIDVEPLAIVYHGPSKVAYDDLSLVVKNSDGSRIVCRPDMYLQGRRDLAAAIQAEINDGDNDKIKLRGYKDNEVFVITYAETEGYKIGVK